MSDLSLVKPPSYPTVLLKIWHTFRMVSPANELAIKPRTTELLIDLTNHIMGHTTDLCWMRAM